MIKPHHLTQMPIIYSSSFHSFVTMLIACKSLGKIFNILRLLGQQFLSYRIMSNWKTGNQSYGSHYSASAPKEKIGKSTLAYLEGKDKSGFVHEEENIAKRERHGLFSQPINLATGDVYKDAQPDRPSKRVEVNQRMQQKVGPQLFSKPGSTNINDPYKDPFRAKQLYLKEKGDLSIHPHAFNAGGRQKLVKHSEFQHQKQYNDKVSNTRDEDGRVKTGLKGVMTNNMKKGFGSTAVGHLFSSYPYIGHPDDDQRAINSNERLIHKAKIPVGFRGSSHPNKTFTPDYAVYNTDEPYKQKKEDEQYRSKATNQWKYNNPNKKGFNGTFTALPQYIQEGEKPKAPLNNEGIWMPNFNGTSKGLGETLSRPCPPQSQLVLNELRRNKN